MCLYRLKAPTTAICHVEGKPALITLDAGVKIRILKADPRLSRTGIVEVEVMSEQRIAAMFMQDISARAERIEREHA